MYHPVNHLNKVMLTLLGHILRDILVPNHALHAPFNASEELVVGSVFVPYSLTNTVG